MKKYAMILVAVSMLFVSCEKWLDLQQEGEITAEQLYSTGEGYRTALNGLYQAMGRPDLYGRELSFGLVDCMSQQYDLSNEEIFNTEHYKKASKFEYQDVTLVDYIDNIWTVAFKMIANANDLIQHIEQADADLFEEGEMERRMIMGEAYACRALMHFDMLRLFAPAPVNDDGQTYVPYVETYPEIHPVSIKVAPFLDKVVADLVKAKSLVADFDTTSAGILASSTGKLRMSKANMLVGSSSFNYGDFFAGRGYRLTYYSITALLARVYQYAGKTQEAFECASEVVGYGKKSGIPPYQDDFAGVTVNNGTAIADFDQKSDFKLKSSLIFAAYNEKAYEDAGIKTYFNLSSKTEDGRPLASNYFQLKKVELFTNRGTEEWAADIRSKNMIFPALEAIPVSAKWYVYSKNPEDAEHLRISPVIRLTEMNYILAEHYARNGNYGDAYQILNDIRAARQLTPLTTRSSWNEFLEDLIGDARREWISEGQLFFLYKRLDAAFNLNGEMHKLTRGEASLPLPKDQK